MNINEIILSARKDYLTHILMDEFRDKIFDAGLHGNLLELIEIAKKQAESSQAHLLVYVKKIVLNEISRDDKVYKLFHRVDLIVGPTGATTEEETLFIHTFVEAIVDVLLEKKKEFRVKLIDETLSFSGAKVRLTKVLPGIIKMNMDIGHPDYLELKIALAQ